MPNVRDMKSKYHFYRYETAVVPIVLSQPEVLQNYEKIVVSISQKNHHAKHFSDSLGVDSESGRINVPLTQDETAEFKVGVAEVQVNIYYANTERDVSAKATIEVFDNLLNEVMP